MGDFTRIVALRIVREGSKKAYLDLLSQDHHLGRLPQRYDVISDFQAKLGGRDSRND